MKLYLHSGLGLTALMLLVGLVMRAAQANWVPALSPGNFYALLTLHGAGMLVGLLLCGMGGLWFLMRRHIHLSAPLALLALGFNLLGVVGVVVATVFGHFAGLYTFLYPMPFDGNWPSWATGVFLISMVLVNIGWMIWCFQMLGAVLRAYGGLRGALGWDFVWHPKDFLAAGKQPPPPEAFPALVAGLDGLVAGMVATLLVVALLVRWLDPRVQIDPLWAKNLTYSFAHTLANLIIYMLAALIYVGLPYATKRSLSHLNRAGHRLVEFAGLYSDQLFSSSLHGFRPAGNLAVFGRIVVLPDGGAGDGGDDLQRLDAGLALPHAVDARRHLFLFRAGRLGGRRDWRGN